MLLLCDKRVRYGSDPEQSHTTPLPHRVSRRNVPKGLQWNDVKGLEVSLR